MKNKIAVIGGGNIGTLIAADLADKAEVIMYSSKKEQWSDRIAVLNNDGSVHFISSPIRVTDSLQEAVSGARFIFITLPSFMFGELALQLKSFVSSNQIICVVPGSGGAEFAFRGLIEAGVILLGFQRVHSIARLKEYGHSVYALGRKKQIEIATIPATEAKSLSVEIGELFAMPCVCLDNYLCVTLTPSNPVLHTSRLYSLFKDYEEGKTYNRNPLFYEEWDNQSSQVLFEMDEELQNLCKVIPLELCEVVSLKTYYESDSVQSFTNKIRSIQAFKNILTPMVRQGDNSYIPDFSSRYFVSDFDFGLKIICDLADAFNVNVPTMKTVYNWYVSTTNMQRAFFNSELNRNDILKMYK
ncbi:MAG: NAD/NADP octopine/nopaline dehydrogenase family protein [Candidatus Coproplasma sp.]